MHWLRAGRCSMAKVRVNLVAVFRSCAALAFFVPAIGSPQLVPTPAPQPEAAFPAPDLGAPQDQVRARMPDPAQGLIRVDVAVNDASGKPVSGLSEEDFALLDNDKSQKIVTFQSSEDAGARDNRAPEVILLIDEMNMLPAVRNGERQLSEADHEAQTFLRANGGALQNPTILYRLTADRLFATFNATKDGNALAEELDHPLNQREIWSQGSLGDDIKHINNGGKVSWKITHSLLALGTIAIEERRRPGRKNLFWIGNGWQIEDRRAEGLSDLSTELLTRMREAQISLWGLSEWPLYDIYGNAVPVKDYVYKQYLEGLKSNSTDFAYLSLPVMARQSGGSVLLVSHNLAAKMSECVKNGDPFYSITFDPPRTETVDERHHLSMQIDKPGQKANVFEVYFDQPVFYDQPPNKQLLTEKQFEGLIESAKNASESDLVRQLNGSKLSEQLNRSNRDRLEKQVHGAKARDAFSVVADESLFLAPPADEMPTTAPPESAQQREILAAAVSYINTTIPRLPDVFATRTLVQYQENLPKPNQTWKTASEDPSLHRGETTTDSIRFHDGKELLEQKSVKNAPSEPGVEKLNTIGTFGPILATVMTAATSSGSELTWSHWEKGETGNLAVFHYRVPQETRLFETGFCCMTDEYRGLPFKEHAPFHGEIAIDPSTGSILRLTIQADLAWRLPMNRSDTVVEYVPIEQGGRTFICPSRSVSISRQRRTRQIVEWGESFEVYAPFETLLNEMSFEKFHIFGSTTKILPGFVEVPKEN